MAKILEKLPAETQQINPAPLLVHFFVRESWRVGFGHGVSSKNLDVPAKPQSAESVTTAGRF